MSNEIIRYVLGTITILYYYLVLAPPLIYFLREFHSLRGHLAIGTRHFQLVIFSQVACILYVCLGKGSLTFIASFLPVTGTTEDFERFCFIASSSLGRAFIHALVARVWVVFYNIRHSIVVEQGQWIAHINNDTGLENDFFMKYPKLGNAGFVFYWLFIPFMCLSLALTVIPYYFSQSETPYLASSVILYIWQFSMAVAFWRMTPDFYDEFQIRNEVKQMVKYSLVALIIFVALSAVTVAWAPTGMAEYYFIHVVEGILITTALTAIALQSSWWVLNKSGIVVTRSRMVSVGTQRSINAGMMSTDSAADEETVLSVAEILSTLDGFNALMKHCIHEFSSENMLCVLELIQFKQFYRLKNIETYEPLECQLPPDICKSAIVFDESMAMHDKAVTLIMKYILQHSPFEVNISGKARMKMVRMMGLLRDEEKRGGIDQPSEMFNEVIRQLMKVLMDSTTRFRETNQYNRLIEMLSLSGDSAPKGSPVGGMNPSNDSFQGGNLHTPKPVLSQSGSGRSVSASGSE